MVKLKPSGKLIFVNNYFYGSLKPQESVSCISVKILVVEDDEKLSTFIKQGLEADGFVVDLCRNGDDGFVLATTREYDALVLDIMLPGRDGLSILRTIREKNITTPVIVLTARSSLNERLDGLKLGADDYMTKPFYVEELAARLNVVTRRHSGEGKSLLSNGIVSLNLITREVRVGDHTIDLTAREFALLLYLMRSPGRVFSRAQICEHVWNYQIDIGTNIIDVYVQKIRKKLGDDPEAQIIETVRGVGYRTREVV